MLRVAPHHPGGCVERITDARAIAPAAMRRCHECGLPLGTRDRFCPRCGAKQPREPNTV